MLSNRMNFSCSVIWNGYQKSSHILSLKYVLEYKAGLNSRIKFVCVTMCSLVMSVCSRDLHVMSLNTITIH